MNGNSELSGEGRPENSTVNFYLVRIPYAIRIESSSADLLYTPSSGHLKSPVPVRLRWKCIIQYVLSVMFQSQMDFIHLSPHA
jgi:hypothetical protein